MNPDLDYMVYTKDGETLIQGVGEYAGRTAAFFGRRFFVCRQRSGSVGSGVPERKYKQVAMMPEKEYDDSGIRITTGQKEETP